MKTLALAIAFLLSPAAFAETVELSVNQGFEVCEWEGDAGLCFDLIQFIGNAEIDTTNTGTWKNVATVEGISFKAKLWVGFENGRFDIRAKVIREDDGTLEAEAATQVFRMDQLNSILLTGVAIPSLTRPNHTVRPWFRFGPRPAR
jgi:hypothetical protein